MPSTLKLVAVSGSTFLPSRTLALVQSLVSEFEQRLHVQSQVIHLGDIARPLGAALSRDELPATVEAELQAIESADLLVVGAPVYRGTYPGLFKHLFDLVGQDALINTPVLLAATGGSERHALVLDHQLRPLFNFFQSLTLPLGVYASNADFDAEGRIVSAPLQDRVRLAVERSLPSFDAAHHQPRLRAA